MNFSVPSHFTGLVIYLILPYDMVSSSCTVLGYAGWVAASSLLELGPASKLGWIWVEIGAGKSAQRAYELCLKLEGPRKTNMSLCVRSAANRVTCFGHAALSHSVGLCMVLRIVSGQLPHENESECRLRSRVGMFEACSGLPKITGVIHFVSCIS